MNSITLAYFVRCITLALTHILAQPGASSRKKTEQAHQDPRQHRMDMFVRSIMEVLCTALYNYNRCRETDPDFKLTPTVFNLCSQISQLPASAFADDKKRHDLSARTQHGMLEVVNGIDADGEHITCTVNTGEKFEYFVLEMFDVASSDKTVIHDPISYASRYNRDMCALCPYIMSAVEALIQTDTTYDQAVGRTSKFYEQL